LQMTEKMPFSFGKTAFFILHSVENKFFR